MRHSEREYEVKKKTKKKTNMRNPPRPALLSLNITSLSALFKGEQLLDLSPEESLMYNSPLTNVDDLSSKKEVF